MTEFEIALVDQAERMADAFVSLCRTLEVELGAASLPLAALERAADKIGAAADQWQYNNR